MNMMGFISMLRVNGEQLLLLNVSKV